MHPLTTSWTASVTRLLQSPRALAPGGLGAVLDDEDLVVAEQGCSGLAFILFGWLVLRTVMADKTPEASMGTTPTTTDTPEKVSPLASEGTTLGATTINVERCQIGLLGLWHACRLISGKDAMSRVGLPTLKDSI